MSNIKFEEMLINNLKEEINQLKKQLEESEEKLEEYKGRYLTTESYNTFMSNEIHKVVKENTELKQQLTEWQDGTIICKWTDAENKIKELEHQLAEKDAEIRVAYSFRKQKCDNLQKALAEKEEEFMQVVKDWKSLVESKNQSKISFAIAKLEKVKEEFIQIANNVREEYTEDYFMISLGNIKRTIDNQIASLEKGVE